MDDNLTNLLPSERVKALRNSYYLRLGTLTAGLLTTVLVVHAILLTPSLMYVREEMAVHERRLANLSAERAASGYEDLSVRVAALAESANALLALSDVPAASDTVRAVLALPRTGITIHSFSLMPGSGETTGSMTLLGTAVTRENLRTFDLALHGLDFVTATDLPLSAYAKESDIPFSIVLTLDFTP